MRGDWAVTYHRVDVRVEGQKARVRVDQEFLNLSPNAIGTRPAISRGESKYTALITGLKRRMTNNIDFGVTYTLAEADKICVFLTRDSGKVRGVAHGARKLKSRFGSALEPCTEVILTYFFK